MIPTNRLCMVRWSWLIRYGGVCEESHCRRVFWCNLLWLDSVALIMS